MRAPYTKKVKEYFKNMSGIKEDKEKMIVDLSWEFIKEMCLRMNYNKDKYPRENWKEPIEVVKLEDALFRHWLDYKLEGNSKENHLAAIALNAMMIWVQLGEPLSFAPAEDVEKPFPISFEEGFAKIVLSDGTVMYEKIIKKQ